MGKERWKISRFSSCFLCCCSGCFRNERQSWVEKEEEGMAARYWCHVCSQMVNPIIDAEVKCPICQSGFVEEISGEINGSSSSSLREVQDQEIDLDREFDSIIRRRRRSSAAILQLLHGIRAGINSEYESSDRNPFNQSAVVHGSTGLNINRSNTSRSAIGDYFVGSGLDHLLEHLADNYPIRHGTLPARKEAVENLPTVKICEPLQCSICLDDFDKGSEAKEMPCKHKFHVRCIVPWLELHNSCPVCRYELPPDDELKIDLVRPRTRTLEVNISNENVEEDARNTNGSEGRFSFPWPFSGLFSSSSSSSGSASGSSQLNENSNLG